MVLGANKIVASYSGGTNYADSGPSAPVVVTCTAGCGNGTGQYLSLLFYAHTPDTGLIDQGTTSTTPVDVYPSGGFKGAVNLTCTVTGTKSDDVNVPKCSFSPTAVTITDANMVAATLTVTTTAPGKSAALVSESRAWSATRGALMVACLVLLGFPGRRRSFALLRVVLCGVVLGGILACGGGSNQKSTPPGGNVTPGTSFDRYTITFRATDAATGTLTAQNSFTLTVE